MNLTALNILKSLYSLRLPLISGPQFFPTSWISKFVKTLSQMLTFVIIPLNECFFWNPKVGPESWSCPIHQVPRRFIISPLRTLEIDIIKLPFFWTVRTPVNDFHVTHRWWSLPSASFTPVLINSIFKHFWTTKTFVQIVGHILKG